jgi:Holliday junction DNA helicase RuvA
MIARLRGTVLEKSPSEVVIDVGGVGYHAFVSLTTFCVLPEVGRPADLAIVTNLRDNALELFGFSTPTERAMFQLLRGVSGVGPRLALAVLSGMPPTELAAVLADGDVARLVSVPGVGKKTAERLVVELRSKVEDLAAESRVEAGSSPIDEDAVTALVGLGYKQGEARKAVRAAADSEDSSLEGLIKRALGALGS